MRAFPAAVHLGILSLTLALLTGCAGQQTSGDSKYDDVAERDLYERARTALDSKRYPTAIERLQALDTRFPFGVHAQQAQLELIYAYHENGDWEEARAAASRFVRLQPDHPDVDYALYLRGLSAWKAGRFSLESLRLIDISKRDLGATRDAYNDFRELIGRFPDSDYAADSRQRIIYLRDLLARHELHVADYYLRRGAFVAAINRGRWVIDNFKGASATGDALATMVEGYLGLGMQDRADETLEVLRLNVPEHDQLAGNGFTPRHL